MANLRQSILFRTDLNFPIGLLAAQCCHIHFENFRQKLLNECDMYLEEKDWMKSPYLFIHKVPNLETLEYFERLARSTDDTIAISEWKDTVFLNVSDTQRITLKDVKVGISLGPCDSDRIKAIIGDLPLL